MKFVKSFPTKFAFWSVQAVFGLLIAITCPHLVLAQNQITTFDPPGAGTAAGQGTFPQQNLNSGAIVGYYVDGNSVAHGFIRSADGNYTNIDVTGAAGTQAYGINDQGTVVGWWFEANGLYHGYLRDDHGDFTYFDVPSAAPFQSQPGSPLVVIPLPLAINRGGAVTGSYVDKENVTHCFVRFPDGRIETFDAPGAGTGSGQGTIGDTNGINRAGAISGGYIADDSVLHGFVRDPQGAITTFNGPGAGTTAGNGSVGEMIDDAGTIPGVSLDNNGLNHAFIRYSDGTFVTFGVTGAGTAPGQGTLATATNVVGITGGNYFDANGVGYGFVRSRDGRITTFDVPGQGTGSGQGVTATNFINDEGAAVGWYVDANGAYHGFIYRSDPPGSPETASSSGTGTEVQLVPTSLFFRCEERYNCLPPPSGTVTLTNVGSTTLGITTVRITGSFYQTNTCENSSLGPGDSCTITVMFVGNECGLSKGAVSISDNGVASLQQVSLSGVRECPL
jgi:hypothetical protein